MGDNNFFQCCITCCHLINFDSLTFCHSSDFSFYKGSACTFRGGNFVKIVLSPSWKGVFCKRKEFAPKGSKFFTFRVDPFTEWSWCVEKHSHKSCYHVKPVENLPMSVSIPLEFALYFLTVSQSSFPQEMPQEAGWQKLNNELLKLYTKAGSRMSNINEGRYLVSPLWLEIIQNWKLGCSLYVKWF